MAVRVLAAVAVPVYGKLGVTLASDIVASRAAAIDVSTLAAAKKGTKDPQAAAAAVAAAALTNRVDLAVLVAGVIDDKRRNCLRWQVDAVRAAGVCGHHCDHLKKDDLHV